MPDKNKILFKDYKVKFIPEVVKVTMEELNISQDKAIELLTEMSYRLDYPKKKKKVA